MKHHPRNLKGLLFFFHKADFKDLKTFYRSAWMGWILYLVLVLACAAILTVVWWPLPSNIEVGSIATHDILSDRAYTVVDEIATEELRQNALSKVFPVFTYDKSQAEKLHKKVRKAFTDVRGEYQKMKEKMEAKGEEVLPPQIEKLRTSFTDGLGISLSVRDFEALLGEQLGEPLETALQTTVRKSLDQFILTESSVLEPYLEKGILVEGMAGEGAEAKRFEGKALQKIPDAASVKENIKLEVGEAKIGDKVAAALVVLAQELIQPTLILNEAATEKSRAEAVADVEEVMIRIQDGESIVRRGNRFEPRDISIIEGIKKAKVKRNFRLKFFGTFLFLFVFLLVVYTFAARFLYRFHPSRKDLIFLGFTLVLMLGVYRIGFSVAHAISRTFLFEVPLSALYYVVPVAAGAIIVRMLRGTAESLLFAIILAVMIGFAPDAEIHYVVLFMVGGLIGAGAATHIHSRSDLLRAGFLIGAAQAFLIIAFEMVNSTQITATLSQESFFWNVGFGFLGGLLATAVALIFAPLLESLFGYLSNIKLLELGSLNHPLLRELIVRAPGTYHHSHMVGTLSEAACQSIGANGLFARVASYFHDIGKMKKSDYFIENQGSKTNRHDSLSPSMSALIILNHVKDGIEMARKYGLPQPIVDIIPQHQGTKVISFFYSRAKDQEKSDVSSVNEKDYRYPGPRPQTREAGVIMLSDGVEAATRSLIDKGPTKLRTVVESMINRTFIDGQLDECELTLRDLHDIADSFTRILTGIYHQRIEYPEIPGRETKGTHDEQDRYIKSQPLKDSSSEETSRTSLTPVRNLRDQ